MSIIKKSIIWLCLILTIIFVTVRIVIVNKKYSDITEININMNEEFEYNGGKVVVTDALWLDKDKVLSMYGEDDMFVSSYDELVEEADMKLLRVTLHVKSLTSELYKDILNWDIVYNNNGNNPTIFTDIVNNISNNVQADMDIYLFFRCFSGEKNSPETVKYYLRTAIYPVQQKVELKFSF